MAQSVNYEVSLAELASRSERRAWFAALGAMLLALILAGGYLLLLPLKERMPYLVMADAYTGTARVAKLTSGLSGSNLSANQAINRANVAHYVVTRESYDHDLLRSRDWRQVFTMSGPAVASVYRQQYSPGNPESPIRLYGKSSSLRINIISITSTAEGWFDKVGGATVRFQRVLVNRTNGAEQVVDTRQATLLYTYDEALPLSEEQRFDNPLGFQVTDYRVERELVSIPVQPPGASQSPMPTLDAAGMPTGPATAAPPGPPPGVQMPATPMQGAVAPAPPASPSALQPAPSSPANAAATNPNGASTR